MDEIIEKKTGSLRLENGAVILCDATLNISNTFNTELIATIGEIKYLLLPADYEKITDSEGNRRYGRMIFDSTSIKRVRICKISYATGCRVCLCGVTEEGEELNAIQELFYSSFEEAVQGVNTIEQYYSKYPEGDWIADCKDYYNFKYPYMLTFPLKPQEIILEDKSHYVANRVVADIYPNHEIIEYQGHDDKTFYNGKEEHTFHEYAGIKNQYKIVKVVEKNSHYKPDIDAEFK